MVLQALKDRIYDDTSYYAARWLAKLQHVIWGLRTQVSLATGFSPFFLVYGSEVVLPTDVTFGAPRIQFYEDGEAKQTSRVDLDSLEEQRLAVVMRLALHEQQLQSYHGCNVKKRPLTSATLSSGAFRRPTACISSLPLGRDPSSSLKLSAHPLTASNGATDKDEDHVWFEDRWMVASLCDE
jgi:hypothetical protein